MTGPTARIVYVCPARFTPYHIPERSSHARDIVGPRTGLAHERNRLVVLHRLIDPEATRDTEKIE